MIRKFLTKALLAATVSLGALPAYAATFDIFFKECSDGTQRLVGLPCPVLEQAGVQSIGGSGLDSVFREDTPISANATDLVWTGSSISLETPRNAFAYFTVVSEAEGSSPEDFTVDVASFTSGGNSIANSSSNYDDHSSRPIQVYKPVYVPTRGLSWFQSDVANYDDRHVWTPYQSTDGSKLVGTRPAIGKHVADTLLDVTLPNVSTTMHVDSGQSHTTWVRVWIPASQPAGTYTSTVTITDDQGQETIPVTLVVRDTVLDDENEKPFFTFVNSPHVSDRFTGIKFLESGDTAEIAIADTALDSAARLLRQSRITATFPSSGGGPVPTATVEDRLDGTIFSGSGYIGPGLNDPVDIHIMGPYSDWNFWTGVSALDKDAAPASPIPTELSTHFSNFDTWKAATLPNAKVVAYMQDEVGSFNGMTQLNKEAGWFAAYNPLATTGSTLEFPDPIVDPDASTGASFNDVFSICTNCDTVMVNAPIMPTRSGSEITAWTAGDPNRAFGLYNGQSPMHYSYMLDERSSGLIVNGLGQMFLNMRDGDPFGMDFYWSSTNFINDEGFGVITGSPVGTQTLGSDNRARVDFFKSGQAFGANDLNIARRSTHGDAGFLYTAGDGYLMTPGRDFYYPANNVGKDVMLPTVRLFQLGRRQQIVQLGYQAADANQPGVLSALTTLFAGHDFAYDLGVHDDGLGTEERSFFSTPREVDDVTDNELIQAKRNLLDLAETSSNVGTPPACTAPTNTTVLPHMSTFAGASINNLKYTIPAAVTAAGMQNSVDVQNRILRAEWYNGYQGLSVVPNDGQIDTGLRQALRDMTDHDMTLILPAGVLDMEDQFDIAQAAQGSGAGTTNCGVAPRHAVVYGSYAGQTTLRLSDTPTVDFSNPAAPTPFVIMYAKQDLTCDHVDPINVNGEIVGEREPVGFNGMFANINIDLGGGNKAGAVGITAMMAQGTIIRNVEVFGDGAYACFGQLGGRQGGGRQVICNDADRGTYWPGGTANSIVGGEFHNVKGPLIEDGSRTPSVLSDLVINHDLANGPLVISDGSIADGGGSVEIMDSVINITGRGDGTVPLMSNPTNRVLSLTNTYVTGLQNGDTLIEGTTGDITNQHAGALKIRDAVVGINKTTGTYNPSNEKYSQNGAPLAVNTTNPVKVSYSSQFVGAAPAGHGKRLWDDDPLHPDMPDMYSLLTDFCITNRGSEVVAGLIKTRVFDAGFTKVWAPNGVYVFEEPLVLPANQVLFSSSMHAGRIFNDANWETAGENLEWIVDTTDSAGSRSRFEGFRIFREGRKDQEDTGTTLDVTRMHNSLRWRHGQFSRVERLSMRQYNAGNKNKVIWRPGTDVRITGSGGGVWDTVLAGERAETYGTHIKFEMLNTTEPMTFLSLNTEHTQNRNDAHYVINNSTNKRYIGNKVECTKPFVDVINSSNIGLHGHGVGCRPSTNNTTALADDAILRIVDSNNVRASLFVPTHWTEHLEVPMLFERNNGTRVDVFDHGEYIALYEKGSYDPDVFVHK